MPPDKTTVEDMVEAIRCSDSPVVDAEGIADAVGLTAYTIRQRRDELEDHEEIATMKIGRTRVYWHVGPPDDREPLSGRETEWAFDEYEEVREPIEPPEDGQPIGQAADVSPGRSPRPDGGTESVENTLTNLTVFSGWFAVAALLAQLANILLGHPYGVAPWIIAGATAPTCVLAFLALSYEREQRTDRVWRALYGGVMNVRRNV